MWQLEIMRAMHDRRKPSALRHSLTHSLTRHSCCVYACQRGAGTVHFTLLQLSSAQLAHSAPGRARGDVMRASGARRSGARVILTDTRARPSIRAPLRRKCGDTTTRQRAGGNNKLI